MSACEVPGCVRVKGHGSFHSTVQAIADKYDRIDPDAPMPVSLDRIVASCLPKCTCLDIGESPDCPLHGTPPDSVLTSTVCTPGLLPWEESKTKPWTPPETLPWRPKPEVM